jgi:hypothetical protein
MAGKPKRATTGGLVPRGATGAFAFASRKCCGPPARRAAGHSDGPCSSGGGASPPCRKSYASIWTPRWRAPHRREGVGAQASSPDWITASKAGIQDVMLRTLSQIPACGEVTIPHEMCACDIREFTQLGTRPKLLLRGPLPLRHESDFCWG